VVRKQPASIAIWNVTAGQHRVPTVEVLEGHPSKLRCQTRLSNPAPEIRWYLGGKQLSGTVQDNRKEDGGRLWRALSTLTYTFARSDVGLPLVCRATVPSRLDTFLEAVTTPELLFKPTVTTTVRTSEPLEEGKGSLRLGCSAAASPTARVYWSRLRGKVEDILPTPELEMNPVDRNSSGTYICRAENKVGSAQAEPVSVNVEYPAQVLRVSGAGTVVRHSTSELACRAAGNPLPQIRWFQRFPTGEVLERGRGERLLIRDTGYEHEGPYTCEAANTVGGTRNTVLSRPASLRVVGPPQILAARQVSPFYRRDVELDMEVCSVPFPSKITWEWESTEQNSNTSSSGSYLAEEATAYPLRVGCYTARLLFRAVDTSSGRRNYLCAENAYGKDRRPVTLRVEHHGMAYKIFFGANILLGVLSLLAAAAWKVLVLTGNGTTDCRPEGGSSTRRRPAERDVPDPDSTCPPSN
jgi:hypothetical protein